MQATKNLLRPWRFCVASLLTVLLFARATSAVTCAECVAVASMLEEQLEERLVAKRKQKHDAGEFDDDGLTRTARQFAISGLSEMEIMQTLGTFCASVYELHPGPSGTHLQEACNELLTPSAMNSIEDSIFQYGTKTVMSQMCIEVAGACEHHNLVDRGEL